MPEPTPHEYRHIPPQGRTHRLHSRTQTHTWGLADWLMLKPETQTCWLTFLSDSGNETTSITLCPGHCCFDDFTSCQLGLSLPTSFVIATLIRVTEHVTLDITRSQVHITSSSPTHLNPQKHWKPASDPNEIPTISHLHALDNKSPPSGGRQSFFPLPRDQPRSLATNW